MVEPVVKQTRRRIKKGPNKIKRAGRHKEKIKRYYAKRYFENKIRNIIRGESWEAAWKWASERNVTHLMPKKPAD